MDWAKAKNILIIAFIITNLFLGYNVLRDFEAKNQEYIVTDERINDVKEIFQEKNIIIKADIQKETNEIYKLTVEYETYGMEEIKERFPGFESEDGIKYYKENEVLEVPLHKKSIDYVKNIFSSTIKKVDKKTAEEIARNFIKSHGFENDGAMLWSIKEKDGKYDIEYKQRYEDVVLENGYMKINVRNDEVVKFDRRWLKIIDIKRYDNKVIPITKALLGAMDELNLKKETEDSEIVITDIKLVYLLDIYKFPELVNVEWYEINENTGTGSLYWRIRLGDTDYIDIEAEAYK